MQLKPTGIAITAVALALPWIWLPALASKHDTIAVLSQYFGMAALIAMALTQIIATRLRFVELIFGGLDRAYVLHKWLGIGALVAILLHDTVDAEMRGLGRETVLTEIAETLGEFSLYGILILVVITIATFIPYHLWRWTHKIMGAFFAFSAFHYLFILKPFSNTDPLGVYISGMCLLGLLAYFYKIGPHWMRRTVAYDVTDVSSTGDATAITLAPKKRAVRHRPGQFAFISFGTPMGSEPHPFTISKAPDEAGNLRMTIAPLGDMTYNVNGQVSVGTTVRIEGPFGRFQRKKSTKPDIWIAAGIGITPFMAWAEAMQPTDTPATLIYCVRNSDNVSHLTELKNRAEALPNLDLRLHVSHDQGRLSPDDIIKITAGQLSQTQVYFCGPLPMRRSLGKALGERGLPQRNFHYEEFEIRTGIGLRRLAQHLLKRL